MQMASEQRDALGPRVVPEEVAGHADLAAAGPEKGALIEIGPLLDGGFKPGGQGRGPREGDTHEPIQKRTRVLALFWWSCCRCAWLWIRFSQVEGAVMLRDLVLALGIPLLVLLLSMLALEQWRDQLPGWLQQLAERPSWLWNTGIGLIIGLSLLRWLL